jgi:hypothetical protein
MRIGGYQMKDLGYGVEVREYEADTKQAGRSGYKATMPSSSVTNGTRINSVSTITSDTSFQPTNTTHCSNRRRT